METAFAARFALILDLLCQAVAARAAEGAFAGIRGALAGPALVALLWTRLRRAAARLQSLADGCPPPRQRTRPPGTPRRPSGRRPDLPRQPGLPPQPGLPCRPDLPRRFGWLLRPVPEAAGFASQLRHLLDDPAMQALITAEPRAGRILRPLCRTLGIAPPPCLRLPPRPRAQVMRQIAETDQNTEAGNNGPPVPARRRIARRYLPPSIPPRPT